MVSPPAVMHLGEKAKTEKSREPGCLPSDGAGQKGGCGSFVRSSPAFCAPRLSEDAGTRKTVLWVQSRTPLAAVEPVSP